MFTDNPTIPAQLEVLLDVMYVMRDRKADRETLRSLIQPKGLPGVTDSSKQVDAHLRAASELGLARADQDQNNRLTYRVRGEHRPRQVIIEAFDNVALANAAIEPWAGRFYAYLLARAEGSVSQSRDAQDEWTGRFMDELPSHVPKENPMNADKFRALMRWYVYVGLGWTDPSGGFVPDPTARIKRALPSVWAKSRHLESGEFMMRLGNICPEIDGGTLFREINSTWGGATQRLCSGALAIALWRLHDEGSIRLHCPADSKGWSLAQAGEGVVQGEKSNRFDTIECVRQGEAN
jgi:hypothetical protein